MRVAKNVCDHRTCGDDAVAAYDVGASWNFSTDKTKRHYEVCGEHDREFFPRGAGFLNTDQAQRIRQELVPS